jgi:Neprosin
MVAVVGFLEATSRPMRTDTLLKLRRGFVAAGLAVVVAGAIGAASVMSAQADEQVPDTPAVDGGSATPAPPTVLPWGGKPSKNRIGRAGASSDQLRTGGQDAAPADTSGATEPRGRYAPKGRPGGPAPLRSETTDVKPSGLTAKSTGSAAAPQAAAAETKAETKADNKVNYFYAVGSQGVAAEGLYASVTVAKPTVGAADYHSLAELALQSADRQQTIEVGWTVNRALNGDDDPHLFVFHWVNGVPTCYNGCGWVQISKTLKPGDTLALGVKKFGIQLIDDSWWIVFGSEYIGYFPTSLWSDKGTKFEEGGHFQSYGEVAAGTDKPCTQMGNGVRGTDKNAAALGSVTLVSSLVPAPAVTLSVRLDPSTSYYSVNPVTVKTMQYGGPGAKC